MKTQKLKTQLMKKTSIYILLLFVIVSVVTSYFLYHSNKDDYIQQNRRFLTVMSQQVNHFLMHPEQELKLIEQSISNSESFETSHDEINFIIERFNYINRVEILNSDGIVGHTFPKDESIIGIDYSRNPVYTNAKYNSPLAIHYGSTFIDPINKNVTMPITLKTRDNNYLVGYLNLSALRNAFNSIDFKGSVYAILDENGNYILYPEDNYVEERRVNENFNKLRVGEISSGEILSHNNALSIIQYQRVESMGWTIILYQELNDMLQPIVMTLLIFSAALIVILMITFYALNYNLKEVDHVLSDFIAITKKVSQGEYTSEVPNYPYSEFQVLSNNFENMIQEVEIREEEILKLNDQLEENYLSTVLLLARTIEAKDTYTGNHCDRVRYYALMIGEKINLEKDDLEQLSTGSVIHDIGKLSIPESVLTKPEKLTQEEYNLIQKHCDFGYDLIKDLPQMEKVKDIVLYHHEKCDGNGYPKGLVGKDIPLLARIVCIADAYDAMTSKRVYKSSPMTKDESIIELRACSDKQFDGALVEVFIEALLEE